MNMTVNEPALRHVRVNGVELAYFERGRRSAVQPTLLFVHATGFHARVWDRIIESFPAYHVLALEQRGHGRSEKPSVEHWQVFGEDLAAFVSELGLERLIGIGHSMGGHAMVDAAARSDAFAHLILCDPTIAEPEAYENPAPMPLTDDGLHPASKRKRHFDSPEDMVARLLPKGAYRLFEPRILDDYCRYGLLPVADGGYELACPPEVEASVYAASRSNGGVFRSAAAIEVPVVVLRAMAPPTPEARMDFSMSPTWPGLAGSFARGRDVYLADCTHFIPMQMPDRVIGEVEAAIAAWSVDG